MFALGALYGGGHDVPMDRAVALGWFQRAAEANHPIAQMMLGRYLARGLAGPADRAAARQWFQRAVAQGIVEAKTDLAELDEAAFDPSLESAPHRAAGD
jgi:TPR repeat protein